MEKPSQSSQEKRQQRIIELIKRDGHIRVSELSELLDVSEITIRRDLILLEKKNLVERTFGGAISTLRLNKENDYYNRYQLGLENKDSIARLAADLIEESDTVFINGGSTTSHIFRYIEQDNVRIVTTNAGCIGQIKNPTIKLVLAGGLYRIQSNSFVGGFSNDIINQINANKTILGVDAISCRHGLTAPTHQAAESTRLMMDRTIGEIIVVTDHRKIGLVSNFVTAPINRIDTLISDDKLDPEFIKELEDLGIKVILTESVE
ncbi:MAG: DeoR/GlpR transcriptional regulator [Spirochaetales bacterium]|nr:DeoR/GlpR transcriptional regulator [Spirochaetales bacterium]